MKTRQMRRQQAQVREQASRQQRADFAEMQNTYNRAFGACMEGKGYSVK
jgi:hypothetical protein